MQKYSKQREEIKKAVMENRIHPTADEVYQIVRKINPTISLGTVYRNLNKLSENGIIRKIEMPNGSDRFDGTIEPHYHIVCTECGMVEDIDNSVLDDIQEKVAKATGMSVTSHNFVAYGICRNCQSKKS